MLLGLFGAFVAATASTGCHLGGTLPEASEDDIRTAVLAHMIAEADRDGRQVRFVSAPDFEIAALNRLSGGKYTIAPMSEAVTDGDRFRAPITREEGVQLSVEVLEVGRGQAAVSGSYSTPKSVVVMRYQLRFARGQWRVVRSQCLGAS